MMFLACKADAVDAAAAADDDDVLPSNAERPQITQVTPTCPATSHQTKNFYTTSCNLGANVSTKSNGEDFQPFKRNAAQFMTCRGGPIKTWHVTFVHIFANYWSMLKILSLAHSADNLQ